MTPSKNSVAAQVTRHHSPVEHVSEHAITKQLIRLGTTQLQLDAIRFGIRNNGWPFDQWSFTFPDDLPPNAIFLAKAYCVLKWLILEDPPATRDRDDAWRLLADTVNAPVIQAALGARDERRKNSALGAEARRLYTDADRARWRTLAADPDVARNRSKRRRAELIAQREGLQPAAVETIRKVI